MFVPFWISLIFVVIWEICFIKVSTKFPRDAHDKIRNLKAHIKQVIWRLVYFYIKIKIGGVVTECSDRISFI